MAPHLWKLRPELVPQGKLGGGVFGEVWKTICLSDKATYAVKVVGVDRALSKLDECVENLEKEVDSLLRLSHPNVVRYHTSWYEGDAIDPAKGIYRLPENYQIPTNFDYSSTKSFDEFSNNYLYIQMEYCEINLKNWMQDNPDFQQREKEVKNLVLHLTGGLQHIHDLVPSLVHRDLKPDNIFGKLQQEKICWRIGDFGLATEENEDISFRGNTKYRCHDSILSCKSDVWALGKIVMEFLPQNANLSPEFQQMQKVIENRMLENNPEKRISAGEANAIFTQLFAGNNPTSTKQMNPFLIVKPFNFDLRRPVKSAIGSRQKQLDELYKLAEFEERFHFITILGLGGVGKSELVKLFLQPLNETRNLIWLQGDNENIFSRRLQDLQNSVKSSSIEIVDIITKLPPIDTVFVIDNVTEITPTLDEFIRGLYKLPEDTGNGKKSLLIVTTRVVNVSETLGGSELRLVGLDYGDAAHLIIEVTQIPRLTVTSEVVLTLCKKLQNLPLALQQAASYILQRRKEKKDFGLENYLEIFEKRKKELLGKKLPMIEHEYKETTLTTWEINFQQVKEDPDFGATAEKILNLLAYFMNPDGEEAEFLVPYLDLYLSLPIPSEETIFSSNEPIQGVELSFSGPFFLEPWEERKDPKQFYPRGQYAQDYYDQEPELEHFNVEDANEMSASCFRLIEGYSLCSFEFRVGNDQKDVQFISLHRLVQEILRIRSEDKERASEFPWISTQYQKLLHSDLRNWTLTSSRRFSKGRESTMENLWNNTPLNHRPNAVENLALFFNHIWLDSRQGYLPSMSSTFWTQVIHTNNFPTEKGGGLILQKYFWHSVYLQLHPPELDEDEAYHSSLLERIQCIRSKRDQTIKKLKIDSGNEELTSYFLIVNKNLELVHPLTEEVLDLCLRFVAFEKLPSCSMERGSTRLTFLTQLFSTMLSYVHKVNISDSSAGRAAVDNLMRIVGHIFDILQHLPEDKIHLVLSSMNDDVAKICVKNNRDCRLHRKLLLHLLNFKANFDYGEDRDNIFGELSEIDYEHYPHHCAVFVLNLFVENAAKFRINSRRIFALLETLLDKGRMDFVTYYCCAALKLVPNLMIDIRNEVVANAIEEGVQCMEKCLWQLGHYGLCVQIYKRILPLLALRQRFELPDAVPLWMDDIVQRASALSLEDLCRIQHEIYQVPSISAESDDRRTPNTGWSCPTAQLGSDAQLPLQNPANPAVLVPINFGKTSTLLDETSTVAQSYPACLSSLAWGSTIRDIWEEEKSPAWIENCRSFTIQLSNHPLKEFYESKISNAVAKYLFSQDSFESLPNNLLIWAFCFVLEFYSGFIRNQEIAVTITEELISKILSSNVETDINLIISEISKTGRKILDIKNAGPNGCECWRDSKDDQFSCKSLIPNFWHLMHAISTIELRLPENLKGTLLNELFNGEFNQQQNWSTTFGVIKQAGRKNHETAFPRNLELNAIAESSFETVPSSQDLLQFVIEKIYRTLILYEPSSYYPAVYTLCNILPLCGTKKQQNTFLNCLDLLKDDGMGWWLDKRLPLISYKFPITVSNCLRNEELQQFFSELLTRCTINNMGDCILADAIYDPQGNPKSKFAALIKFYKTTIKFFPTPEALEQIEAKSKLFFQQFMGLTSEEGKRWASGTNSFLSETEGERFSRFLLKYGTESTCQLATLLLSKLVEHYVLNESYIKLFELGISLSGCDKEVVKRPDDLAQILDKIRACFQSLCVEDEKREKIRRIFGSLSSKDRCDFSKGSRREYYNSFSDMLQEHEIKIPVYKDEEESDDLSSEYEDECEQYVRL